MPYLFVKKIKKGLLPPIQRKTKNLRKTMYFPGKAKSFAVRTGKGSDLSSSLINDWW